MDNGTGTTVNAGWFPDPTGRHQSRYWDGVRWTEFVADQGQQGIDPVEGGGVRQRSGCLTVFLGVVLAANFGVGIYYLSLLGDRRGPLSDAPEWLIPTLVVASLFNAACAVGLLMWKRWGFYGIAASSVIVFVINVSVGVPLGSALGGFIGIAILFSLLQAAGKGGSAWSQLE